METVSLSPGAIKAGGAIRSKRLLALAGDDRLVEQIRRGSDVAFEVLYERHVGGILSFCRHMLGSHDEAEDAVQHSFAAAYRDLLRDEREIAFKAWLYTIARNRCLSILRARRELPAEATEAATGGLHEQVARRADLRDLVLDLGELPEVQRAALVLTELGDLSHAEVARVLGVETSKVKALVFRARSSLIERRHARETPCGEIREQLSLLRGGALRRSELRHHLRHCEGCRAYREEVHRQRAMMAVILPVTPSVGLKANVVGVLGLGGSAAGGGAGAGLAGAALTGPVATTTLAKVAVVALVVGSGAVAGKAPIDRPDADGVAPAARDAPASRDLPTAAERRSSRAADGRRSARPAEGATPRHAQARGEARHSSSAAERTPPAERTPSAGQTPPAGQDQGLHREVRARGPEGAPRRPDSPGSRGVGLERRSPNANGTPSYGAGGGPAGHEPSAHGKAGTAPARAGTAPVRTGGALWLLRPGTPELSPAASRPPGPEHPQTPNGL